MPKCARDAVSSNTASPTGKKSNNVPSRDRRCGGARDMDPVASVPRNWHAWPTHPSSHAHGVASSWYRPWQQVAEENTSSSWHAAGFSDTYWNAAGKSANTAPSLLYRTAWGDSGDAKAPGVTAHRRRVGEM